MGSLSGKVALVTGAARGIGQAIADDLASEGADLVLCDLQADWLGETAAIVTAHGRQALCLAVDVAKGESVSAAVDEAVKVHGRIDVLVNNAGITRDGLMMRMSEEDWDTVIGVNLKGTFLFTKAVSRQMMKQRSGAIVNVASVIGVIGNAGQSNYAASKGGVIALTKSSAKELASRNVRVNAVAPGFIETRMTEVLPADVKERMLSLIPLGRFGSPKDVARVVSFLAGDASAYMTGQVLRVCGGMVT
jgi:3-oxoacyl-[acyl-carrier protein] reductase